jgi:predicted Zn finger-like uncharacterized protein
MSLDVKCPGCKAAFAVPDRLDGKLIRCKTCRAEFRVGGEPPPPADDFDEYGEPRPRRRAPQGESSSSALPIILAVGGVLFAGLVIVVGLGVWFYADQRGAPANVAPPPWAPQPKMAAPRVVVPNAGVPNGGVPDVAPPALPFIPEYTFPPLKAPRAFGRPDQPTEGAVLATLSNPRKGPDFAGEPTWQIDYRWQGNLPQASDQLHLYVKAGGEMTDTFVHRFRDGQAGTLTFRFFPRMGPAAGFEFWMARRKLERGGRWEYTRVSNVVKFD